MVGPCDAAGAPQSRGEGIAVYARSTTFLAQPGSIDEGVAYIDDEVRPALMDMDGCIGLSMICDRDSGRCIVTSAWSSEDAMNATEQTVQPLRDKGVEIFGAQPSVDRWEIAVLHRDAPTGEGACVRCTWLSMDASGVDDAIETYRMATLPALEEMDGFRSASLMVDRASGRAVGSVTFTNRDAMVACRSAADELRSRTAAGLGASVTDVCEFDLALAHLHVPEMV
jgi:quinol monooxygenase YgiN